ncbi:hypothetical protein CEN44_17540 [Fischerella muscicola CCMEE 5323]|uniref:DUF2281 domain-containing protein n=1 Tax=Fischerella muscicola CCMEE 5323 TaxID=2019572 RepID=A0A2N6K0A8_FISMU|nr:hypothetical protein CEN44_17540 [Fischerella muscicola CCMEE 5323]
MPSYQEVLQQAQNLTPEEQIRLIEHLSSLIRQRVTMKSKAASGERSAPLGSLKQVEESKAMPVQSASAQLNNC